MNEITTFAKQYRNIYFSNSRDKPVIADIFHGLGAATIAAEAAGCRVDVAIDKDIGAHQTYTTNHVNTESIFCKDIKDKSIYQKLKECTGWLAGFSCQPFSGAGGQKG